MCNIMSYEIYCVRNKMKFGRTKAKTKAQTGIWVFQTSMEMIPKTNMVTRIIDGQRQIQEISKRCSHLRKTMRYHQSGT